MKSTNELRQEAKGVISKLSDDECLALLLMYKDPCQYDKILSNHSRDEIMAVLEVLERVGRKYPGDEECQTAIKFIKSKFP